MRFYKYLKTKEACLSVIGGNIRFSTLSELNDPSELFNFVNKSETDESLKRLRREGYSEREMEGLRRQEKLLAKIAPEMIRIGLPKTKEEATAILRLPLYTDANMLQTMLNYTVEIMRNNTGIFCVSEKYDSYPMWAHYANNAKGYIVEFDDLEKNYKGDETGVLNALRQVTYATPRPSVTFEPDSHVALFFSKLSDWSYEYEYRVVKPLVECTYDSRKKMHLAEVDINTIKRVIVGWNSCETTADITKQIAEVNPNIKVTLAKVESGKIIV